MKVRSYILVFTKTWSDRAYNVFASYSTRWVWSVASMRSIHDFLVPYSYVKRAGWPGWMPFKMCQLLDSHVSNTHFALLFTISSSLSLIMVVSPSFGCRFPTLAFQSPHIVERECVGIFPSISSVAFVAASSVIPRVWRFVAGGRYTFPTQIISPPCP